MNKTFRFTIILIGVVIVVAGIGFWRHHYLKVMNAEPVNVYKDTSVEPDTSPKGASIKQKKTDKSTPVDQDNLPKDTSEKRDDNTDGEMEPSETTQPIDTLTPEETDNTGNLTVHPIFSDIIVENLPPKAAAALKKYDEGQLASDAITSELTPLLEARPVDFDAIKPLTEKLNKLNQQRLDALEILALYSDKASKQLEKLIERKKEADSMMAQTKKDIEEARKMIEEVDRTLEKLTK